MKGRLTLPQDHAIYYNSNKHYYCSLEPGQLPEEKKSDSSGMFFRSADLRSCRFAVIKEKDGFGYWATHSRNPVDVTVGLFNIGAANISAESTGYAKLNSKHDEGKYGVKQGVSLQAVIVKRFTGAYTDTVQEAKNELLDACPGLYASVNVIDISYIPGTPVVTFDLDTQKLIVETEHPSLWKVTYSKPFQSNTPDQDLSEIKKNEENRLVLSTKLENISSSFISSLKWERSLLTQEETKKTINEINQLLAKTPENIAPEDYFEKNTYDLVIKTLKFANIRLGQNKNEFKLQEDENLLMLLGKCAEEGENFQEAINCYQKLDSEKHDKYYNFHIAELFEKINSPQKAEEHYRKALQLASQKRVEKYKRKSIAATSFANRDQVIKDDCLKGIARCESAIENLSKVQTKSS